MQTFKDAAGREWLLEITVAQMRRVKAAIDVDLCRQDEGEPALCIRLDTDPVFLFSVLWALVKAQADKYGITEEQFCEAFPAEAAGAAVRAFWQELEGFFQSVRPATAELIAGVRTMLRKTPPATPGEESTNSPDSPESIQAPAPSAS